jgi:multidrug efflux pump subunit AcrA (membrane-fusion protein)
MRRPIALVALVVVLLAAAGYLVVAKPFGRASSSLETARVTRGALQSTVELAGTLAPRESRSLTFGTSGTVRAVSVVVGDTVTVGQVLATLDDDLVRSQVAAAETALRSAQARLDADRAGLTSAQLASAKDPVTQAKAALGSAQQAEKAARSQRSTAVAAAQATLDEAEARLAADTAAGAAEAVLTVDRLAIQAAQANLASVTAQADGAVAQAVAAVMSARSALTAAQHAYDVRIAPAPTALIAADEAAVASAELSLATARQSLSLATITSPIAGTITEVGFRSGDRVGGIAAGSAGSLGGLTGATGGSIVVQDLGSLRVMATASEIDVVALELHQKADVTLDAIPALTLAAEVCELGRTGSSAQGVVEYPVTLCMTNDDERVRTGMSANISIVLARRDDVLMVPTPAIRTVDGKSMVRVIRSDDSIDDVEVVTGISSGTRIEIVSGLAEGDEVVVGSASGATR